MPCSLWIQIRAVSAGHHDWDAFHQRATVVVHVDVQATSPIEVAPEQPQAAAAKAHVLELIRDTSCGVDATEADVSAIEEAVVALEAHVRSRDHRCPAIVR